MRGFLLMLPPVGGPESYRIRQSSLSGEHYRAHAASILKKTMPDTLVVFFTMYEESVCGSLASAAGVDVVLSKADGIAQLVNCARGLLNDSESDLV